MGRGQSSARCWRPMQQRVRSMGPWSMTGGHHQDAPYLALKTATMSPVAMPVQPPALTGTVQPPVTSPVWRPVPVTLATCSVADSACRCPAVAAPVMAATTVLVRSFGAMTPVTQGAGVTWSWEWWCARTLDVSRVRCAQW